MKKIIKLGTRGSPLALKQAELVRAALYEKNGDRTKEFSIEIVPIKTSGDWRPSAGEQTFLEAGATKGLFTKEIEEALLRRDIDFAVHSMKDVSVWTPSGLVFAAILPREDPRDAFISARYPSLAALPQGARVGTASLRRKAQILMLRPDLNVAPLRGNVETRLQKLEAGEADATLLAMAGLNRLGMQARATALFEPHEMLPAAAQGVLGVETREDDAETRGLIASLHDEKTAALAGAERAVLRVLDGSCRTPIAALAEADGPNMLKIEALAAKPDGSFFIRQSSHGPMDEAEGIGLKLGGAIKDRLPSDFLNI